MELKLIFLELSILSVTLALKKLCKYLLNLTYRTLFMYSTSNKKTVINKYINIKYLDILYDPKDILSIIFFNNRGWIEFNIAIIKLIIIIKTLYIFIVFKFIPSLISNLQFHCRSIYISCIVFNCYPHAFKY